MTGIISLPLNFFFKKRKGFCCLDFFETVLDINFFSFFYTIPFSRGLFSLQECKIDLNKIITRRECLNIIRTKIKGGFMDCTEKQNISS